MNKVGSLYSLLGGPRRYLVRFHLHRLTRVLLSTRAGFSTFFPLAGSLIFTEQELKYIDPRDQNLNQFSVSKGFHTATFESLEGRESETGVKSSRYEKVMASDNLQLLTNEFEAEGVAVSLQKTTTFQVQGLWSQFMRFLNRRLLFLQFLARYQAPLSAALIHLRKLKQNLDLRNGLALYQAAEGNHGLIEVLVLMFLFIPILVVYFVLVREIYFFRMRAAYLKTRGQPMPESLGGALRACALNQLPKIDFRLFLWASLLCINDVISDSRGWIFYFSTRLVIYFMGYISLFNRSLFLAKKLHIDRQKIVPPLSYQNLKSHIIQLQASEVRLKNCESGARGLQLAAPGLLLLFFV